MLYNFHRISRYLSIKYKQEINFVNDTLSNKIVTGYIKNNRYLQIFNLSYAHKTFLTRYKNTFTIRYKNYTIVLI